MHFLFFAIDVDPTLLYVFLGGVLILYMVVRFLAVPLRMVWRACGGLVKGAAVILLVNAIAASFNQIALPFNLVNALLVGHLGVPGMVLIVALRRLLT